MSSYVLDAAAVLFVEVAVTTLLRVLVLTTLFVVVFVARARGVESEERVEVAKTEVSSVGAGASDTSISGVVIAGSVPRKRYWNGVSLGVAGTSVGELRERPINKTIMMPTTESPPSKIGMRRSRLKGERLSIKSKRLIVRSMDSAYTVPHHVDLLMRQAVS